MSDKFNVQIISPDKTILKSEVFQVTIPAYEGLMTILKDHTSIVTFLRPGFIEAEINNEVEKIYVEEGTVEFSNNNLLILSSTARNKKDFSSQEAQQALEVSKSIMKNDEINDKEKYFLSYKIAALQQVIN